MPPASDKPKDPKPEVSDSELLSRYLAGDEGAFETIVNRYRRELYNFLARFTGNRALAEDVFQETFLQLHISAGTFDTSKRLKPWLFTIAANKARDAIRSRARRQAAPLDAVVAGSEENATTYATLMPTNVPGPDEFVANLEMRQAVQRIVSDMSENLRLVLLLSYFHNLAYKEIAEILDVPLGTVKSRLHAAVALFARTWKSQVERKKP